MPPLRNRGWHFLWAFGKLELVEQGSGSRGFHNGETHYSNKGYVYAEFRKYSNVAPW